MDKSAGIDPTIYATHSNVCSLWTGLYKYETYKI